MKSNVERVQFEIYGDTDLEVGDTINVSVGGDSLAMRIISINSEIHTETYGGAASKKHDVTAIRAALDKADGVE